MIIGPMMSLSKFTQRRKQQILLDPNFQKWCTNYLAAVFRDRARGVFTSYLAVDRMAKSDGIYITASEWELVKEMVDLAIKNNEVINVFDRRFSRFQHPMTSVYQSQQQNRRLATKDSKSFDAGFNLIEAYDRTTIEYDKQHAEQAFKFWANKYLKQLIQDVAKKGEFTKNLMLEREFKDAAHCEGVLDDLCDLSKFANVDSSEVHITNKKLKIFTKPLRRLFHQKRERYRNNLSRIVIQKPPLPNPIPEWTKKNQAKVSYWPKKEFLDEYEDLEKLPAETLNVVIDPSAFNSCVGSDDFCHRVHLILLYVLQRHNMKWVSGKTLSGWLRVDQHDFESWANEHLATKKSTRSFGVTFFSLKSRLIKKGIKMSDVAISDEEQTLPDSKPNEAASAEAKPKPLVGSTEFETLIAQFLASGNMIWRSTDSIAEATGYTVEELSNYLNNSQTIIRRPGQKANVVYYASFARVKEGMKEPPANSNPAAVGSAANDAKDEGKPEEKKKAKVEKSLIGPKELLAFAMLHTHSDGIIRIMNFYGNQIAVRHPEAFSHFTQAQKNLSAGVALLKDGVKVGDKLLPELEEL